MSGLIDTHCHLDLAAFDEDRETVIQRARQAGVTGLIIPAIDLEGCPQILSLSEEYPEVYAAVGVHPNDADSWTAGSAERLIALASHERVVAIGEIGLDYYWKKVAHDVQQRVLRAQLEIAAKLNLPVILHNREATGDLLSILAAWVDDLRQSNHSLVEKPGVLHSFSGNLEEARKAVELGFMIGLTGPLTFKNAAMMQQVAQMIPIERLLIETDAPYLSPHPYRGERNEPAFVQFVAQKLAALRGLDIEEVTRQTHANACQLFGLGVAA